MVYNSRKVALLLRKFPFSWSYRTFPTIDPVNFDEYGQTLKTLTYQWVVPVSPRKFVRHAAPITISHLCSGLTVYLFLFPPLNILDPSRLGVLLGVGWRRGWVGVGWELEIRALPAGN